MSGKRDKGSESKKTSFMSHAFPDISPLEQSKLENTAKDKPTVKPLQSSTTDFEVPSIRISGDSTVTGGDSLSYQGNGIQNRVLKDLKRGSIAFQDVLDLHGQTIVQAHDICMQFIQHSQQQNIYCILIIHGRGYRSSDGVPVLKQQVNYWLREHPAVLAFSSAQARDGGKGAVYVLLSKLKNCAS